MAILVVCSSCAARLKVGEQVLGKRIKCPSCGEVIVAAETRPAADNTDPDEGVRQPKPVKAGTEEAVTEVPRPKVKPPAPVERVDPFSTEEEQAKDRPEKKKKKKKKKKKRNFAWALVSAESRPLLLFGGSGIIAVEFFLLVGALIAPSDPLRFVMAYFFAMLPISTFIFIGSLYVGSLFGALEIGEIPITLVKGFFLVLAVNIAGLFPYGVVLAVFVWLAGILLMFHMDGGDVWIVRILIGINWFLNLIAQLIVISVLTAIFPISLDHDFADNMPAGPDRVWEANDIRRMGGQVGLADGDEEAVIGISLANRPIRDADLAHMKDFPWLRRLRLMNTPITDAGLIHLRECRKLEELNLTGTRVTDAGVRDLQQALPKCLIMR